MSVKANPNDRLEVLRGQVESEIQAKENELESLRAKLTQIIEFSKQAETIRNPRADLDKYSKIGLTNAILDALPALWKSGVGESDGVSAGQICKYLLAHGFVPQGSNFEISVIVTLKRLAENRRVIQSRISGRRRYKPKE